MIAGLGGGGSGTSVASLLAGTHSAQVWMDGPDKIRVVTAAPLAETNWIRNGTDVWSYDSATLTATHATVRVQRRCRHRSAGHDRHRRCPIRCTTIR